MSVTTPTDAATELPATPSAAPEDTPDDDYLKPGAPNLRHQAVLAAPAQLVRMREQLTTWAGETDLSVEQVQALELAVYEAMANVVEHAYPGRIGTVTLHAVWHGDTVRVTVTDHGQWQPAPRPGLLHGRGLPPIHTLATTATIESTAAGTTVTMTWTRAPRA
ncbi:ATP-binding protein [Amycolatopsis sp. NPDC049252]|uniref:ATP-binding protein n=1 Tax=Amycolatopsis sp. NPDC049252 TaxID=3363933 RepID=UPI00371A08CD